MLVLQRNSGVSARNVPFAEMDGKMERTGLPSAEQARLVEAFRKHSLSFSSGFACGEKPRIAKREGSVLPVFV